MDDNWGQLGRFRRRLGRPFGVDLGACCWLASSGCMSPFLILMGSLVSAFGWIQTHWKVSTFSERSFVVMRLGMVVEFFLGTTTTVSDCCVFSNFDFCVVALVVACRLLSAVGNQNEI